MKVWIGSLLIFLSMNLKGQQLDFILAGQDSNVIYTDLVPDFDTVGVLYAPHLNGKCGYNLDLNNDSIADYEIVLNREGGQSGSMITVSISAIDTTNRIAAEYDSLYCFPWDTLPALTLCKSLADGDTIDVYHQEWIPSAYMYFSSYFQIYGLCQNGDWLDRLSHIAGLMMPNGGDTIYGWVRVQVSNIYFYNVVEVLDSLVVFDYAATKGFVIEPPVIDEDTVLKIYPNPSIDNIQVNAAEVSQYEIFNIQGALLKSGWLQKGLNYISTEHLPDNYYFLVIHESDRRQGIKVSVIKN